MIQRIQTVYLLVIVALMTATLFLPLAIIQSGEQFYRFDATGLNTLHTASELVYPTWALFALTALIALLALCTIFLFKKRILQIRLCVFNALLMIGYYALFFFFYWNLKGDMEFLHLNVKIGLSFPFICLVLDYLAIRNIGADETLVRSLNRLR